MRSSCSFTFMVPSAQTGDYMLAATWKTNLNFFQTSALSATSRSSTYLVFWPNSLLSCQQDRAGHLFCMKLERTSTVVCPHPPPRPPWWHHSINEVIERVSMFVSAMTVQAASSGEAETLGLEDGVRLSIRGVMKRFYEVAEACVDRNHSPEETVGIANHEHGL